MAPFYPYVSRCLFSIWIEEKTTAFFVSKYTKKGPSFEDPCYFVSYVLETVYVRCFS